MLRAWIERLRHPGYSYCYRCRRPWATVTPHTTFVPGTDRGYFPLCEACWRCLTPDERLPYYRQMYEDDPTYGDWPSRELAVRGGG